VLRVWWWLGVGESAGPGEEPETVHGVGDQRGPGRPLVEVEQYSAAGAGQRGGQGEDPQPEPFRFPSGSVVAGGGKQLGPGGELGGEPDQRAPDPVLSEVVQRQVSQAGVLGVADPVLRAGAAAVLQLEIGELPTDGVGGEGVFASPADFNDQLGGFLGRANQRQHRAFGCTTTWSGRSCPADRPPRSPGVDPNPRITNGDDASAPWSGACCPAVTDLVDGIVGGVHTCSGIRDPGRRLGPSAVGGVGAVAETAGGR